MSPLEEANTMDELLRMLELSGTGVSLQPDLALSGARDLRANPILILFVPWPVLRAGSASVETFVAL